MVYTFDITHSDQLAGNSGKMDREAVEREYELLDDDLQRFLSRKGVTFKSIVPLPDGRRVAIEAEDQYAAKDALAQYEASRKTGRIAQRSGSICLTATLVNPA